MNTQVIKSEIWTQPVRGTNTPTPTHITDKDLSQHLKTTYIAHKNNIIWLL